MHLPRITFGIIVLNGEPFTRYNLRALYPFAHQIIIVEGASPKASHAASSNGHSLDKTLSVVRDFQAMEDPEQKVMLVTAEDEGYPDGFWQGEKDEQSRAYAVRATGDWLWQIDIDEFYHYDDMAKVCDYLYNHPETTCLTFNPYNFWGGFAYVSKGGIYQSIRFSGEPGGAFRRVFKWDRSYRYFTHRPPTIVDAQGKKISDARKHNATKLLGVRMYHYPAVLPFQITAKPVYYERQGWTAFRGMAKRGVALAQKVDLQNGIRISSQFGTYNWLERYDGAHPQSIVQMRQDIQEQRLPTELRDTTDIELLLDNPVYQRRIRWLRPLEKARSYWHLVTDLHIIPVRRRLVAGIRRIAGHFMWLPLPPLWRERLAPRVLNRHR